MRQNSEENKVSFVVAKGANKTSVAIAIEQIYGFKPESVNIMNVRPKKKRVGRYVGKTSAVRKAIVKLPEGKDITLFNDISK